METMFTVHVEICQHASSTAQKDDIQTTIHNHLNTLDLIAVNSIIYPKDWKLDTLMSHVDSIICSCDTKESDILRKEARFHFYFYRLTQEDVATETMQNDSEELPAASHWVLPSKEFHFLWENLYYDSHIKENLLRFAETAMVFSDHKIDPNVISWNKVVLLYGPPGTGKTSLCKALAQKITIRLQDRFSHGELIEINSHSLFSKWYSESGKLVMKLFNEIKFLLENPRALVCILIDEIESLAHVRKACTNGTEPSDSIRVVNALLTQLDQMKRYPNVLILTTSNMTEAIDLAFVDRADIKQYVGHPTGEAITRIYNSSLKELLRAKLVQYHDDNDGCYTMAEICRQSEGLSGRILKKIPFLAYALAAQFKSQCSVSCFLYGMHLAVVKEKEHTLL